MLIALSLGVFLHAQTTSRTATFSHSLRGIDAQCAPDSAGNYKATFTGTAALVLVYRNGLKMTAGVDMNVTLGTGAVTVSPLQAWSKDDLVTIAVISAP